MRLPPNFTSHLATAAVTLALSAAFSTWMLPRGTSAPASAVSSTAAATPAATAPPRNKVTEMEVLSARRIEIVDEKGNIVAVLKGEGGKGSIEIVDYQTAAVAKLACDVGAFLDLTAGRGGGSVLVSARGEESTISGSYLGGRPAFVCYTDGRGTVSLGVHEESKGGRSVALRCENGKPGIVLDDEPRADR